LFIGIHKTVKVAKACGKIENLIFFLIIIPSILQKIITMDWMSGIHISEFAKIRIKLSQMDNLCGIFICTKFTFRKVHADPHLELLGEPRKSIGNHRFWFV
jgi:hypothetical protein